MNFSPRFLEEIRNRVILSELIGNKIRLSRAGREFKGCCPFHKEKTPSFYVNDDKQFYHCFGCGAHGDVVGWTMQYENRSFPEAIEQLAAQAGLEMPKQSPQDIKKAREEKNLYQLMDDATAFFEVELHAPHNHEALSYIHGRGFEENTLSAFRIGFASGDRQALYHYLKEKGYTDTQMMDVGLIRKDKSSQPYAFFRERIMFPVTDKRGRIVAFGGRILPDHLRPPDRGDYTPAKYMNSSDTPLFHKGRMLYGAAHAAYAAREGAPLIVTEGYLDVIACWQAGFRGAVAPLGTALTEDQILSLWRMSIDDIKAPILCFDGDTAGQRAAMRAAERALPLLKPGHSLQIMFMPEGEDPDTFIHKNGATAFHGMLEQAIPLVEFLFTQAARSIPLTTPEERAALNARLDSYVTLIPDRDVQYHYQKAFRDKCYRLFSQRPAPSTFPSKKNNPYKKEDSIDIPLKKPNQSSHVLLEKILLATVIMHPELFSDTEERLGSLHFSHPALENIRNALFTTLDHEISLDFEGLKSHLISVGLEGDLSYTLNDSVLTHAGFIQANTEHAELLQNWTKIWSMMERQAG